MYFNFGSLMCLRRCGRYSQSNGWEHSGVSLPAHLLFVLEEGDCTFTVEDKTYRLEVGDVLLVPQGKWFLPNTQTSCKYQYFHFYADITSDPLNTDICTPILDSGVFPRTPQTLMLRHRMSSDYEIKKLLSDTIDESKIGTPESFLRMNLSFLSAIARLSERATDVRDGLADKIREYIEKYWINDPTLTDIASHFGYSKQHVIRIFTDKFKISPIAYAERLKIQRGARLLSDSQMTVSEVGASVGFSDANYFSRRFKKHFGMSPTDYRQKTAYNDLYNV